MTRCRAGSLYKYFILLGREDHGVRELWNVSAGLTDRGSGHRGARHPHLGTSSLPPSHLSSQSYLYLYQGSVVVFGSWPDWTSEDVTSEDYCKELPMHFAFGILVTAWVSITIKIKYKEIYLLVNAGDDPPDVLRLYLHHLLHRLCCRLPGSPAGTGWSARRGVRCPGLTWRRRGRSLPPPPQS